MNFKDEALMFSGDGVLAFLTAAQSNELMQWISLALTILTTILTLAFTIYKWVVKAKEDGHITPDEIQELIDEIDKARRDTENIIDKVTKEDTNNDQ